jgi:hypothetical protein
MTRRRRVNVDALDRAGHDGGEGLFRVLARGVSHLLRVFWGVWRCEIYAADGGFMWKLRYFLMNLPRVK